MAISYNKPWKLFVDKKMNKAGLRKTFGVTRYNDKITPGWADYVQCTGQDLQNIAYKLWSIY